MVELVIFFAACGGLAAWGAVSRYHAHHTASWRQFCDEWKRAAADLGFTFGPGNKPGLVKMYGSIDELDVVVDTSEDRSLNTPLLDITRLQVFTFGGIPKDLSITRLTHLQKQLGHRGRLFIGDRDFDDAIAVQGDETVVRALLDPKTRSLIKKCVGKLGVVVGDSTVYRVENGHVKHGDLIRDRVRMMTELARLLIIDDDTLAERLLAAAESEPHLFARRRAYQLLFGKLFDRTATRRAIPMALQDRDPLVRAYAAGAMGSEGLPYLEGIATAAMFPAEARVAALSFLVRWLTFDDARAERIERVLDGALKNEISEVQSIIIRAIGAARAHVMLPSLAKHAPFEVVPAVARAYIEALWQLADPAGEPALIELLQHADLRVRISAARALGAVGTIAAVQPLLASSAGLLGSVELKDAARYAVKMVQGRLRGVEAGGLAVVDGEADRGALSVARESAGQMSLAHEAESGSVAIAEEPPGGDLAIAAESSVGSLAEPIEGIASETGAEAPRSV
jgi:HEAT repeat protein